jgi:4-hydroxybenzoate polyprenyltransferase
MYFTTVYGSVVNVFMIVLLYQVFHYSFAYLINNLSDYEIDLLKGKKNPIKQYKHHFNIIILVFLAFLSILITIFSFNLLMISLGIVNLLLATLYSIKPVRLKERSLFGLIPPILGQRVIPFLMFGLVVSKDFKAITFFTIYFLLLGLYAIIEHQLSDYQNDRNMKVTTFAVRIGSEATGQVKKYTIIALVIFIFLAPGFFKFETSIIIISILILYSIFKIKIKNLLRPRVNKLLSGS